MRASQVKGKRSGEIVKAGRRAVSALSSGRRGQDIVGSFQPVRTMARLTSYQSDIRPLFTERDIRAMSKAFNLASYDDVKAHAAVIYDRIRGIGGNVMPPPPPRERAHGPRIALSCLLGGWLTVTNLSAVVDLQNGCLCAGDGEGHEAVVKHLML